VIELLADLGCRHPTKLCFLGYHGNRPLSLKSLPHAHLAVTLNPSSPSRMELPDSGKQQQMRNRCVLTLGLLVRIVEKESGALSQEELPLILLTVKV